MQSVAELPPHVRLCPWRILCFLTVLTCALSVVAQKDYRFQHLTTEDGLPSDLVFAVWEDRQGFIWAVTPSGLSRYDGYHFKPMVNSKQKMRGTVRRGLQEDDRGHLWIPWLGPGLYEMDPSTGELQLHFNIDDTVAYPNVVIDQYQNIWVAGFAGMQLFDREEKTFTRFPLFEGDTTRRMQTSQIFETRDGGQSHLWVINPHNIYKIPIDRHLDNSRSHKTSLNKEYTNLFPFSEGEQLLGAKVFEGQLWVGSEHALYSLDLTSHIVQKYQYPVHWPTWQYLEFDTDGTLWIGNGEGLLTFDPASGAFTQVKKDPSNPHAITDDQIHTIFKDRQGTLWFSTLSGGINRLDKHDYNIRFYAQNEIVGNTNEGNEFQAIKDGQGNIWVGTSTSGLYRIDPGGSITNYRHNPNDTSSLMNDYVTCLMADRFGKIWVGVNRHGFSILDPDTGIFVHQPYPPGYIFSIGSIVLFEDENGGVYFYWPLMKVEFDRPDDPSREVKKLVSVMNLYPFTHVMDLETDRFGNLWVADYTRLFLLNQSSNTWKVVEHDDGVPTSLSSSFCTSLLRDDEGTMWIATYNGLNKVMNGKVDPISTEIKFHRYMEEDGLTGTRVVILGADDEGDLWLITSDGLFEFDKTTEHFSHYDIRGRHDYGNYVMWNPEHQAPDGEILVGCTNGFLRFDPNEVKSNPFKPPVVITDFKIDNKSIQVGDTIHSSWVFNKNINLTEEIVLVWNQNDIALEFAALDFTYPEQNQYAYRLVGLQDEWVQSDTRNEAFFTNLDHGKYTFEVKGSNNDGVWSDDIASIQITVLPPPWLTWWAYTLYGAAAIGLLLFSRHEIISRERLKGRAKLEHMELEKAREVDTLKTQFFSNISHEFRTPLTLILGPIERLRSMVSSREALQTVDVMERNGQRLQRLINQLLDLSRLDSGRMELQPSDQELVAFLKGIWAHFEQAGKDRSITYSMNTDCEHYWTSFDRDKLEKAIFNLLSNAFKFTEAGGRIMLELKTDVDDGVEIRVSDTGRGIPQEQLTQIFDRFYQADATLNRKHEGSGIGLALARQFVELHDGTIGVESKEGQGSTFTIELPLEELSEAPAENELLHGVLIESPTSFSTIGSKQHNLEGLTTKNDDRSLVLVIDDNPDMRQYLWNVLSDNYKVLEAVDGLHGRKLAFKEIPDLIVSDIMMPGLDGQELCQQLKQDERTSHIPIILLTARAGEKAKLQGLETGADDYITKPFSPEELKARVKNLIALRHKLRTKYSGQFAFDIAEEDLSSVDRQFLEKVVDQVEEHRSDSAFNPDALGDAIGLSRSQLHRKLKALTDMSTTDFIKCYRLKYARLLLEKGLGNVVEVGYQCGFNSPSYFTTSFKKLFGAPPSEFIHSTQQ